MRHPGHISPAHAVLAIIDLQEKLAAQMEHRQIVIKQTHKLIETARVHHLPIVITEQYPKGLGATVEEVAQKVPDVEPIEKISFSACDCQAFVDVLRRHGRHQIICVGMETHICIQQTALDLVATGLATYVPADAVCSRHPIDWQMGLEAMRDAGVMITTTESAIFQLLRRAGTAEFKALLPMMK